MKKVIFILLSISEIAHSKTMPLCNYVLNGIPSDILTNNDGTEAIELGAKANLGFLNVLDPRILPAKSPWGGKADMLVTEGDYIFRAALERASMSYSVVKPSQFLPLAFKHHGDGFYFERIINWSSIKGLNVVGYTTLGVEYLNFIPGVGYEKAKTDRLYFSGTVVAVEMINNKLKFTLKTPTNDELVLEYASRDTYETFLILAPKRTSGELLRRAFLQSSFENVVSDSFGSPSTKEDYDMAAAIVETVLSVPVTFGRSAVTKILLGRNLRGGDAYTHFGLARGKKRYSEKHLQYFIGALYSFMDATGVMSIESREVKGDSPEWLGNFAKTSLSDEFRTIWKELQAVKGGATLVIVEKEPRKEDNLKLSRDVAKPGTKVVVKSDVDGLAIGDDFGQSIRFVATPGQVLEIVKGPRSVRTGGVSLSLIRLRDPLIGLEGEVFWSTAINLTFLQK